MQLIALIFYLYSYLFDKLCLKVEGHDMWLFKRNSSTTSLLSKQGRITNSVTLPQTLL
jgi:hypothetical protein